MAVFDEGEFLDLLYTAAIEPGLWVTVMERLADLIGGTSAFLSRLDVVTGMGTGLIARIDPDMPALYLAHYADKNILSKVDDPSAYSRSWRPRILTDEDWVDKETLVRGEYYNGFLRPQDVHSVLMIRLALRGTTASVLNVHRGRAHDQFGGKAIETAARLHPHLIRAFVLGERLADDRRLVDDAASVFDDSKHALFLVDGSARLLRHNAAAESLLQGPGGLSVANGRLFVGPAAAGRVLEGLIRSAVQPEAEHRSGGSMPFAGAIDQSPRLISVSPVPPGRMPFPGAPYALVSVTDLSQEIAFPAGRFRQAFGLTAAEERIASMLFTGANAREAAARLGVSPNTVHIHISRLFEKTGARRQSELMSLMMRVAGAGR